MSEATNSPNQAVSTPNNEGAAPAVAPDTVPRRFKAKVDGKEVEVSEDELVRDYQKFKSADSKFQEASKLREQTALLLKHLKSNPVEVLERLGIDVTEMSYAQVKRKLDDEMMTPEQRERVMEQAELERYRKREKEDQEKVKNKEREEAKVQLKQKISSIMVEALEASPYLAKDEASIMDMARYMHHCEKHDIDYEPRDLAKFVEQRNLGSLKAIAGQMDVKDLLRHFPDLITRIREHYLNEMRQTRGQGEPATKAIGYTDSHKPTRMTPREARELAKRS